MKKICLVAVCYNSHDDAIRLLSSIEVAFNACSNVELDVLLCDNSTVTPTVDAFSQSHSYSFKYLKSKNVGYFPAFNMALATLSCSVEAYDFVIVCNVDLVIAEDFFSVLRVNEFSPEVGVVAPGIFSDKDGRDLNPKMRRRPSVFKINFMRVVCSNVVLFRWYHKLVRMREQARSRSQERSRASATVCEPQENETMYGAHGSFMIFTKCYFAKGAHVAYPRFLFGEEGFVAEQVRIHGLKIKHFQALKVFDKEHASTSQVKLDFICSEHKKSYDFFYNNFLRKRS